MDAEKSGGAALGSMLKSPNRGPKKGGPQDPSLMLHCTKICTYISRTIIQAVGRCDLPLLERALTGEFGDLTQDDLNDALVRAANLGYAECVSRMLAEGADPECEDGDGDTPLALASSCNHIREHNFFLLSLNPPIVVELS